MNFVELATGVAVALGVDCPSHSYRPRKRHSLTLPVAAALGPEKCLPNPN